MVTTFSVGGLSALNAVAGAYSGGLWGVGGGAPGSLPTPCWATSSQSHWRLQR